MRSSPCTPDHRRADGRVDTLSTGALVRLPVLPELIPAPLAIDRENNLNPSPLTKPLMSDELDFLFSGGDPAASPGSHDVDLLDLAPTGAPPPAPGTPTTLPGTGPPTHAEDDFLCWLDEEGAGGATPSPAPAAPGLVDDLSAFTITTPPPVTPPQTPIPTTPVTSEPEAVSEPTTNFPASAPAPSDPPAPTPAPPKPAPSVPPTPPPSSPPSSHPSTFFPASYPDCLSSLPPADTSTVSPSSPGFTAAFTSLSSLTSPASPISPSVLSSILNSYPPSASSEDADPAHPFVPLLHLLSYTTPLPSLPALISTAFPLMTFPPPLLIKACIPQLYSDAFLKLLLYHSPTLWSSYTSHPSPPPIPLRSLSLCLLSLPPDVLHCFFGLVGPLLSAVGHTDWPLVVSLAHSLSASSVDELAPLLRFEVVTATFRSISPDGDERSEYVREREASMRSSWL